MLLRVFLVSPHKNRWYKIVEVENKDYWSTLYKKMQLHFILTFLGKSWPNGQRVGLVTQRSRVQVSGPAGIVGGGEWITSALSTFNTTTEMRPLNKATEPPTAPWVPQRWLPTAPGVCSRCVFTAVCAHLNGLNAEHKFQVWVTIHGHTSLHFKVSLQFYYTFKNWVILTNYILHV